MKKHLSSMILLVFMLAGLSLLLYPTVSDYWNSFHQSKAIANYAETVNEMDEAQRAAMLAEARAYNEALAQTGNLSKLTDEQMAAYNSILDITGTGIMGYIDIPIIGVSLPIYHGVEESVLQVAVGHLAGTAFPIGGKNTHCVVSGHRGLPTAKLFTNLDEVAEGDVFTVQVLDQTVTYLVDQIRIVLPAEVDDLQIEREQDYMTLVTCTPYGVNTHRLLVRGHRIENAEEMQETLVVADATQVDSYLVALFIAVPVLVILVAVSLLRRDSQTTEEKLKKILRNDSEGG